jgi:NTE family protein
MSKNIALVLSGGGARGIAHIGVINVLKKHGFNINAISGTSMGALVGGVYCCNELDELQKWLENATIQDAIKILDYSFSAPGFIKGDKLMKKINSFLLIDEIEQLPIPYTANATNMTNNGEVVFRSGNLSHAIRSSISIPSVFTPVIDGEKVLVDGGLKNNIPINRIQKSKGDLVFAVCVNSSNPISKDYQSIMFKDKKSENTYLKKINKLRSHFETIIKSKSKSNNKIGQYELIDKSIHMLISEVSKKIIESNPPDVLIEIPRQICGTFDFLKAKQIIKVGELATEKKLIELKMI